MATATSIPDAAAKHSPAFPAPSLAPGAADCHVHVFDPARFPFAADTPYQPVPAEWGSAPDLAATLDASGVERVVLINPTSGYGNDNRCMLDAIAQLGPRARGIARVPLSIGGRELDALVRGGVVGVRVDFIAAGLAPLADPAFPGFVARLAERNLVLDLQGEADQWTAIVPAIASTPVRAVVDHLGRPRPDAGPDAPGFRALLGLASTGRVAVKLSGPMRCSLERAPFADLDPFVLALVREFSPQRLVFGSDWPFLRSDRRFDYGPLLAFLGRVVASADDRRAILSTTPARWFGWED